MRVGFDVRPALRQKTGVGRYLAGLLPGLVDLGVTVVAFSASWKDRLARDAFRGAHLVDRRIPVRLLNALWSRCGTPSFEILAGPADITHSPTPLAIPSRRARRVVTLHDLYFLRNPDAVGGEVRRAWLPRLERAVARADAVVCVSDSTARDARSLLRVDARRLHVVHHGLEPHWREPIDPAEARALAERIGATVPFLLAVGSLEVRKNFPRLASVFDRLRRSGHPNLRLVIAGPDGPDRDTLVSTIGRLGVGDSVVLAGYQDDGQLKALYATAALLVMPSLDEGFGFPVLEAMAAGCPVVAAMAGALPEVGGDAALYVDPRSEDSILDALRSVLGDKKLASRLRAMGPDRASRFEWSVAAWRTREVYRQVIEEPRG